jgi:uncharacterized protein (DUF2345 family)
MCLHASGSINLGGMEGVKVSSNTVISLGVAGGNYITIDGSGIYIQGNVVLINSGGPWKMATGGSFGHPPDAAKADPKVPAAADKSKTGQKSTPF